MTDTPQAATGSGTVPAPPATLTREGYDRLRQDVTLLRDERRPALVQQLQRATLFMDATAGAGVAAAARFDLDALDRQITTLEDVLKNAKVTDVPPEATAAQLGSQVTVRYEDGTEERLTLVNPWETDPGHGFISSESPAGRALLGKRAGADVTIGAGEDALMLSVVKINTPSRSPVNPDREQSDANNLDRPSSRRRYHSDQGDSHQ
jgi:transcription elongation factor GreA